MFFWVEVGACPWDRIVQLLVGSTHLACIEAGRVEKAKVHCVSCARPYGYLSAPLRREPCKQAVAGHIAAMVKGDVPAGVIDVVAREVALGTIRSARSSRRGGCAR